ncbi:hypothetical protein LG202_09900 [Methylobacillus methanolivorans]
MQIELNFMNIDINKNLSQIELLENVPWLARERYSIAINNLFSECDTDDQIWLICKLLSEFKLLNSTEFTDSITLIAKHINSVWCFKDDAIICATSDSDKPDGSQSIIRALEVDLNPKNYNAIYNNISPAFFNKKNSSTILLVDDFLGTGTTMLRKIQRLKNHLEKKDVIPTIYFACLAGMNEGFENLKKILGDKNVFIPIIFTKAISENITDDEQRKKAINAMLELEYKILPITPYPRKINFKEYNFGFNLSEALYCQEGANIPNNVFPIFWKGNLSGESKSRKALFHRV